MNPQLHPDTLLHQQQIKQIRRGGTQAADTAAMEAMFDAITAGKSREEAEKVFTNTYKKYISYEVDKLQGSVSR